MCGLNLWYDVDNGDDNDDDDDDDDDEVEDDHEIYLIPSILGLSYSESCYYTCNLK